MKQQNNFSDDVLNAYIDGEISPEEELSILDAMQHDSVLAARINELKRIKLLVSTTYRVPELDKKPLQKNNIRLSLVASVLLMVGVVSGWTSHDFLLKEDPSAIAMEDKNVIDKSLVNNGDSWNIVLHVNSNDEYVQKTILDETENLLESFKESNQKVKVEIVAYGKGIFLFDNDKTKYKNRLQSLKSSYGNLSYAVCGRTVKRLEKIEGRKIQLISKMTVARSGIYQIIKRQKQGWNYIRI